MKSCKAAFIAVAILSSVVWSHHLDVLTGNSIDKLSYGRWFVLVHDSKCSDSICSLLKHAWLLLLNDADLQTARVHLASFDAEQNRISKKRLSPNKELPQMLLIINGRITRFQVPLTSISDLKKFALSDGEGFPSYYLLNEGEQERPDDGPSVSGLSTLIVLFIGMSMLSYFVKGGFFESRSLKQLQKMRRVVAKRSTIVSSTGIDKISSSLRSSVSLIDSEEDFVQVSLPQNNVRKRFTAGTINTEDLLENS